MASNMASKECGEEDLLYQITPGPTSVQSYYTESDRKLRNGKSKAYGAVFIVVNAAMGAGLLAFPYAYSLTGGWQFGILVQLVSSIHLAIIGG